MFIFDVAFKMKTWFKSLVESNKNYRLFSRQNKSVFIRDDSCQKNVMEMHNDLNSPYILFYFIFRIQKWLVGISH